MFRRSTPHQCSLVHIHTCGCIAFIHVLLLSPSARGTTQHNQHMWTCAERHRARVLKRPQGKCAIYTYIYIHTYIYIYTYIFSTNVIQKFLLLSNFASISLSNQSLLIWLAFSCLFRPRNFTCNLPVQPILEFRRMYDLIAFAVMFSLTRTPSFSFTKSNADCTLNAIVNPQVHLVGLNCWSKNVKT